MSDVVGGDEGQAAETMNAPTVEQDMLDAVTRETPEQRAERHKANLTYALHEAAKTMGPSEIVAFVDDWLGSISDGDWEPER